MTDIMSMTAEEIRITIAKAHGLKPHEESAKFECSLSTWVEWSTPDWTTDMNAAYELEAEVPEEERANYAKCLVTLIKKEFGLYVTTWELSHATAEQRCRAWLMWKEREG